MRQPCILAIDQGTTNTKALLVDEAGSVLVQASRPLAIHYPQPGWVEQDPMHIWESTRAVIDECLARVEDVDLLAIAITNQRETTVAWERASGRPLGPAIGWQCQRTDPFCRALRQRGLEPLVRERTGLTIAPMFSATKMRWLLDSIPEGAQRATRGELCVGTIDSWLLWHLTGGTAHACDYTNASRTQLFNLRTLAWDDELLDIFGLPAEALPDARPSSSLHGHSMAIGALRAGVPIACLIGDSHGAMFGHASFDVGSAKATYGTGSSLMSLVPHAIIPERGISATIAWGISMPHGEPRVTYALEGNIYVTGAAVQWIGELLALGSPGRDIEKLAAEVEETEGVYFVPAFTGLGAPHWDDAARGMLCGLTRGTRPAHVARATLEAIAYQVRDVLDAMEAEAGQALSVLRADGGASQNDLLMQLQADILGRPVVRCTSPELSALGAAYLAGMAIGLWPSYREIEGVAPPTDRFEPQMPADRRETLYAGWRQALARAMFRPEG
jgi:glycerol kinase